MKGNIRWRADPTHSVVFRRHGDLHDFLFKQGSFLYICVCFGVRHREGYCCCLEGAGDIHYHQPARFLLLLFHFFRLDFFFFTFYPYIYFLRLRVVCLDARRCQRGSIYILLFWLASLLGVQLFSLSLSHTWRGWWKNPPPASLLHLFF